MVTLDQVPDNLYDEILENDEQLEQWRDVYNTDQWDTDLKWHGKFNQTFLNNHPSVMIDTAFFDDDFKLEILSSFEDVEKNTDGVLLNSENFQAMNLISSRFRNKIKFVYADPPYNTEGNEILYKNNFKHSSWLSLIADRLILIRNLLANSGIVTIAIDSAEQERLGMILGLIFDGFDKELITVRHNPRGQQGGNFMKTHEYAYFIYPEDGRGHIGQKERKQPDVRILRDSGNESNRVDAKNCFYPFIIKDEKIQAIGEIPDEEFHPEGKNVKLSDRSIQIWPMDGQNLERKWRYSRSSVENIVDDLEVRQVDGKWDIYYIKKMSQYRTIWMDAKFDASEYGTKLLQNMFHREITKRVSYPKSLHTVLDSINAAISDQKGALILDPFAGSGTTGHATIDYNKTKGTNHKYILIEMAEYFDSVIRQRIIKTVLSSEWIKGVPTQKKGTSQCVRYQRLESYEDTLNNISLGNSNKNLQNYLEGEVKDFASKYMIDFESRESASLLPEGTFDEPFSYELMIEQNGTSREPTTVDLVETFHYLLGANVRQYWHSKHQNRKYVVTECEVDTESGVETVLTAWRRTKDIDYDKEKEWFDDEFDTESYDRVYVNGESQIAQAEPLEITFREKMEESPNVA
jgi:adenine-specific DNA-methyltransferase